jgi:hypothetical protein
MASDFDWKIRLAQNVIKYKSPAEPGTLEPKQVRIRNSRASSITNRIFKKNQPVEPLTSSLSKSQFSDDDKPQSPH